MEIYKEIETPASKEFAKLLNSQLSKNKIEEGKIVEGKIAKITEKFVFLFIEGLKSEPVLDINEVKNIEIYENIKVGDKISVLLERIEDKNGEVVVSASKAQKIKGWFELEKAYEKNEPIEISIKIDLDPSIKIFPFSELELKKRSIELKFRHDCFNYDDPCLDKEPSDILMIEVSFSMIKENSLKTLLNSLNQKYKLYKKVKIGKVFYKVFAEGNVVTKRVTGDMGTFLSLQFINPTFVSKYLEKLGFSEPELSSDDI